MTNENSNTETHNNSSNNSDNNNNNNNNNSDNNNSSNKIDYTSVRRTANVKLSEQTQEPAPTNTMSTSTSLQDISSHHAQKFTWNNINNDNDNNNNDNKDQPLAHFYDRLLSSNSDRQLSSSRSDEFIFEHPEITIKPSALDDEIQRRLSTMKSSNTNESLVERSGGKSIPNILEHPDMRSPVVMQSPQMSLSSSSSSAGLLVNNNCKKFNRTQSVDNSVNPVRTLSSNTDIELFNDNTQKSSRSLSSNPFINDIFESVEQEKNQDLYSSSSTTTDSIRQYSKASSKSDINTIQPAKEDSW
ncbi:unnamed protein product [Rotaria magnacalcarata]|uniref:Uncharacterized protein n=1 Tax=Rotaria magnacalcarata TaxID=392030 RepID=A0A8S2Q6M7_9BILA|nr:unnamed protein product [Rotaria magnacalcarata]CAF3989985.1 unnamed protein product [Rotaria magnacalcarata]CAF4087315.1 unnamed protein product [Rotaria magnacalcarata]